MNTELIFTTIGATVTEYAGIGLLLLVVAGYFILSKPEHHHSAVQAWVHTPGHDQHVSKYHQFINSPEYPAKAKTKTDYQEAPTGQILHNPITSAKEEKHEAKI